MRLLLFILILSLGGCSGQSDSPDPGKAPGVPENWSQEGFLRADQPRKFLFPEDHGPHQGYRTEWWYITGNLETPDARQFGYQITLFRIALTPQAADSSASLWRASHVWMAHLALTDVAAQTHYQRERFSREALGLAGATADPLRIWVEEWDLYRDRLRSSWQLSAGSDRFTLQLELKPLREPVLQGENGLSQKGDAAGNASYYYSITRLATSGTLTLDGESLKLQGLSWLDREWSTSALSDDQTGWDWFSLQLDDATDLMFYRLRQITGGSSPQSAGSVVLADGSLLNLNSEDVILTARRWWNSGDGIRYPVAWELFVKPLQRQFVIEALVDDQEMNLSVRYWEGAVKVTEAGVQTGLGYLEMTGY